MDMVRLWVDEDISITFTTLPDCTEITKCFAKRFTTVLMLIMILTLQRRSTFLAMEHRIRSLAEYLGAVFLLDKYHINKCITESLAFCPELRSKLWQAVKDFDLSATKSILSKARKAAETEAERQRVTQCRRYLIGNWDGIYAWKEEAPHAIGCSA